MSSDILLNDGSNEDWVTVQASVLRSHAADLIIDSPPRRSNNRGYRRAFVHNGNDGLTVNFNGDYPGGVTLNDVASLYLRPRHQDGGTPRLPVSAVVGELVMINNVVRVENQVLGEDCTLWLCVGRQFGLVNAALWKQVQLGAAVAGTE
jgi:hypothetical protein